MSFRMSVVLGPQFKAIVNERIAVNSPRARKAIAKARELTRKLDEGQIRNPNTPGLVKNHAEAAEAANNVRRWEAIGRRVSR